MLQHCASKSYLTKLFPYFFLLLTSQRRLQDCWCPPGLQRGGDPLCEGGLPLARRGGGGGAGRHRDVEQQHRRQRGNAAGAPQQCLWFTISGLLLVVASYQNTGNTACHLGNSAQLPSLSGFLPCAAGGGQEFEQQHMRSLALRWGQITQSRCNLLLCSLSSTFQVYGENVQEVLEDKKVFHQGRKSADKVLNDVKWWEPGVLDQLSGFRERICSLWRNFYSHVLLHADLTAWKDTHFVKEAMKQTSLVMKGFYTESEKNAWYL